MRIAIYSDNFYPELSGIADTILTSGKELARRGHLINFFAPKYSKGNYDYINVPYDEVFLDKNIQITRFSSLPYPTGTKQSRLVIPTGLGTLKLARFDPDVIHTNVIAGVGLEALFDAKILRRPLVGTNHTPIVEFLKYLPVKDEWVEKEVSKYDAWYYNQCEITTSPSKPVIDQMRRFKFKGEAEVMPNPINTRLFKKEDKKKLKKKFGISDFSLFYSGRLAPEKRVDLMIKAAAKLKGEIPELSVVIAGHGKIEADLKELVQKSGLGDKSKFFGFIEKQEEFAELYNANDVFCMLSIAETQSISMMNAMACEIPVIAVKAWGLKDYIHDGKNGVMIEPDDLDTLIKKIRMLYKDKKERERLGKAGCEYVDQFSIENIGTRWENLYLRAIEKYNSRKQS